MSNLNKYGEISPATAAGMKATMLKVAQEQTLLERFGQKDPMPKNKGKVRNYRRYDSLPPATSPLAEGVTPAGRKISFTDYSATLEEYGDFVELTDVIQDLHTDPVLEIYSDRVGKQMVDTVETVRYYTLRGGTNVFYAANVSSRSAVNSPPTRGDFRRIYRAMMRNRAEMISKIIKASALVSTEPVAPAFFAIGHTDLDADIRGIPGFVPVEKYSDSDKSMKYEIGKVENIRVLLYAMATPWLAAGASGTTYMSNETQPTTAGACDVYPILVFGADAYAIEPLQGSDAVTPIVLKPNVPRGGDELGQRGSVGWKRYDACCITNQLWMARLECAATANPI